MTLRRLALILSFAAALAAAAHAQNSNTSGQRNPAAPSATPPRVQAPPPRDQTQGAGLASRPTGPAARPASAEASVRAAFDTLVDGIRRADVETVMGVYWSSPQLVLFNNNGTVTKSWQQVRANRQSSYPNLRDVKLDVRDVRVHVLSPTSAFVSCLWSQTQTVREQEETATGRLTLVFQRVGGAWKIVHTHTSPDRPDPTLIPPSEREPAPTTTPADPAAKPPAKP